VLEQNKANARSENQAHKALQVTEGSAGKAHTGKEINTTADPSRLVRVMTTATTSKSTLTYPPPKREPPGRPTKNIGREAEKYHCMDQTGARHRAKQERNLKTPRTVCEGEEHHNVKGGKATLPSKPQSGKNLASCQ